jgi:hypothetical protein
MQKEFISGLLIITLLSGCVPTKPVLTESKFKSVNIDSIAKARADSIILAKFGNTKVESSYYRPESNNIFLTGDNYKDEIYVMPGMIFLIRKEGEKTRIEETGYYVRKPNATLDIEMKVDKPFFSSVIEKGFSTDIDVMSKVSTSLDSKSKAAVEYKTIQVVILEPNEIDIKKADSILDKVLKVKFKKDTSVLGYFIARSVTLNLFSYSKFSLVEGNIKANGMAFQVGLDTYYKSNSEQNTFEVVLKGISRKEAPKTSDKSLIETPQYIWQDYVSKETITDL